MDSLPPNVADPKVLPTMCKPIQQAISSFPRQAERVMNAYGLAEEEFLLLHEKTQNNWWFAMKVRNQIKQLEKEKQKLDKMKLIEGK